MEDLYGRSAYMEGWGPHRAEDFASTVGKAVTSEAEVDVDFVQPAQAVQKAMELHS
jgi:hypothetical protein